MPVEGRGLSSRSTSRRGTRAGRLAMSLPPPPKVQKLQDGVACQSEGIARLSVLRAVRQGVPQGRAGVGLRPLPCQRRRAGGRRPDVRGHRGVRAWTGGWTNWRKNSGSERIDPNRCDGCTSPNRMASNGRWGSPRSGIAWCRWRWCWSWSRSSRPTWSRSNTPTGPTAAPWTPSGRSTGWSTRGIRRWSTPTCRATSTASRTPS